jgi:hypothetical protein
LTLDYLCAPLTGGAFCSELLRVTVERACIYLDWSGARLIPSSFAFLNLFVREKSGTV